LYNQYGVLGYGENIRSRQVPLSLGNSFEEDSGTNGVAKFIWKGKCTENISIRNKKKMQNILYFQ
jgi:hypothetical protein